MEKIGILKNTCGWCGKEADLEISWYNPETKMTMRGTCPLCTFKYPLSKDQQDEFLENEKRRIATEEHERLLAIERSKQAEAARYQRQREELDRLSRERKQREELNRRMAARRAKTRQASSYIAPAAATSAFSYRNDDCTSTYRNDDSDSSSSNYSSSSNDYSSSSNDYSSSSNDYSSSSDSYGGGSSSGGGSSDDW